MKVLLAGIALVSVLIASSARAQDPFSTQFDLNQPKMLTGTISRVMWGSPHTEFEMRVLDDAVPTMWRVELDSSPSLERIGWQRQTLPVGARITIDGWVARADMHRVGARVVTLNNGKVLAATAAFAADGSAKSKP